MRAPMLRARRGVTLPELLVAMLLLAIVGGAMTRVIVKQAQYYKDLNRSAGARRELRLGATVLPAEIRSISTAGGDIISMSESQIVMRAMIGSSIICARNLNTIIVPPANLAHHKLTSFVSTPGVGDTLFLFDEGDDAGAVDDSWQQLGVIGAATSLAGCPGAPYTDPVLDPPASKPRLVYLLEANLKDSVKVGAVVRFSRAVRYQIASKVTGTYLSMVEYRNGAWDPPEMIAGPFRPYLAGDGNPSGIQFRYFDTLGVRITDFTKVKDVGRIDVRLRTNAGTAAMSERLGSDLRDSVVMRVAIRNSK